MKFPRKITRKYPSGSKPGILYRLGKFRKALQDEILAFYPIFFSVGMPTNKLAKFCDKLLKPIITNEYTIKDSFLFAQKLKNLILVLLLWLVLM